MSQTVRALNSLWVKFMLVLVASICAVTLTNAGQAVAHSGTYNSSIVENYAYTVTINQWPWSGYCTLQYQVGELYGVIAYARFRVVGRNTDCAVGIRAHTQGTQPAGNECFWYSWYGQSGCVVNGGWYFSQSNYWPSFATQHWYTDVTVAVGDSATMQYFDFRITSISATSGFANVSDISYCGSNWDNTTEGCFGV